ncbi:MAG: sugar ABC transporter permease [Treponema sp.]|nr:sugar ABC transporter permease [Treponema sp.]
MENIQFTSRIQGAAYAPDNSNIILVNNRGEVLRIDRNGKEIASQRLLYELVDLKKTANNEYLVLSKPGSYHIFDGNLNIMREKMVNESFPVTGRTVGSDTSGQYTVIGTNEGFLYFFDKNDNQIFSTRVENGITDFLPIGEDIYLTGLGDFVYKLPAEGIRLAGIMSILKQPLVAGSVTLAVAALFCVLFALGATRSRLIKFGIIIYRHRVGYLLILPTFVLLVFFNYSSIFLAFTRAFTNWSRIDLTWATMKFIGFDNFREMLHDRYFFVGIKNLVLLMVTAFAKLLTVPLIVAWLVYSMKINRQKTLFRFLFVLPMVVPGVVSALMWKQIYDPSIGLINQFLTAIGLENWRQVWLGNEKLAIWSVIFMGFPFVNVLAFLVYYGGLMDIDPGIIESARIDGAGKGKIFFNIQLPILLSQIKVLAILTFIGTMQDYGGIYLLTGGGPGSSTYVPGLQLYYSTASTGRYGYACALGIVLFIFTMIGTLINMKMKTHSED